MTDLSMLRRTVLQSGVALAAPLAFAGLCSRPSHAAPSAIEPPLSGTLAGWVVVEPDYGATVRLVQLDAASQPVRHIATSRLTLAETGASFQQVCQRAHELAVDMVARSWSVPSADCVVSRSRIAHEETGHSVGYTFWADVA